MSKKTKSIAAIRRAVKIAGGGTKTAAALGVGKALVSRWCSGDRTPTLKHAIALAHASDGAVSAVTILPALAAMDMGR